MISSGRKIFKFIAVFLTITAFFYAPLSSQQLSDSQIKAGYIYNFIKNITWQNEDLLDTITIAVLGKDDEIFASLKEMEYLKVRDKTIRVEFIRSLNQLTYCQVLYISRNQNDLIQEIFRKLKGDNTLLVTDQCEIKHTVMINFIYTADSLIKFEVNSKNIEDAGLILSPKLILLGGSEIDVRNLYRETERTLVSEKEKSDLYEKELILKKQELDRLNTDLQRMISEVESLRSEIALQKTELKELASVNAEQQISIDKKNSTLDIQKREIQKREEKLIRKELEIVNIQQQIKESNRVLLDLRDEIRERQQIITDQENILSTQQSRIQLQRSFLIVLAGLIIMAILVIVLIYRNVISRQKKNIELEKQNTLIKEQHDQIAIQNQELEMHRNQLEKLIRERTSDLMAAKEKAEESDRLKSSFLANMSHEIRTPLNAIIGFIDLLFNENLGDEERNSYKQIVNNNSELLLQLINDILDLALIESEQFRVELAEENLSQQIQLAFNSCKVSKLNSLSKDLTFKLRLPDASHYINTDALRFRQILLNLIDNAIKYTERGTIEIGYFIEKNRAVIFVKDTGIGIEQEQQTRIFDRFTKIESPGTRLYRGIGLGLAIVKKLVGALGGEIWVESEPGKGSCFFFTQALVENKNEAGKESFDTLPFRTGKLFTDKTILVCEDDDSNFFLLEKMLSSTNLTIHRAKNGQEAVDYCTRGNKPDLVLMDIKMPVMDGIKATQILKGELHYSNPIIAQTAYATQKEVKDYSGYFDAYLTKPIVREELINSLNVYLTSRKE